MAFQPHKKQALAMVAFMAGKYNRGILLWGRQCFAADTQIKTKNGYKRIADIVVGDEVLSYGTDFEYKPVLDVYEYGVDVEPKPMLEYSIDGQTLKSTYDHPYAYNGQYVPIYQLAWGDMDTGEREKLQLLCKQYGAPFDDPTSRSKKDGRNETSFGPEWVFTNSGRPQDGKDTPPRSRGLDTEPREQIRRQPQKRHQNRQSNREPRVDDSEREYTSLPRQRMGGEQAGRELRDAQTQRIPSIRDSYTEADTYFQPTCPDVRGFALYDRRHRISKKLVSHIAVSECETTYGLEVSDNRNFCVSELDILVKNTGKTYFCVNFAWMSAIKDQGRYAVVFKTYKQAHEVVWRQYVPLIPKELVYKTNEQDLLIEFNYVEGADFTMPDGTKLVINHDTSKPRSTLQLLGSDQADSHRGFRMNGIIFDEYGDQNGDNFGVVYEPMFATTNGWAMFVGTPRGYNHFYDMIELHKDDPNWFYSEATWRDSPYVTQEFIKNVRRDWEKKGNLSGFLQEYELEFRSVQGAVYPLFDRKIHVRPPSELPDDLTIYSGIDFGWHTTACLLVGIDKDQNWWVFDEIYGKEETLDSVIPRIKARIGNQRLVLMVGDSASRDAIEVMQRDFPIVGVSKNQQSIPTGIALITEKLKARTQLIGGPKPSLFFTSNCKNMIREMESYKFPEDKPDRNPSDVPVKEDDHGPDALRYLMLHLKYGVQKDDKIPKSSVIKEWGEYGL